MLGISVMVEKNFGFRKIK